MRAQSEQQTECLDKHILNKNRRFFHSVTRAMECRWCKNELGGQMGDASSWRATNIYFPPLPLVVEFHEGYSSTECTSFCEAYKGVTRDSPPPRHRRGSPGTVHHPVTEGGHPGQSTTPSPKGVTPGQSTTPSPKKGTFQKHEMIGCTRTVYGSCAHECDNIHLIRCAGTPLPTMLPPPPPPPISEIEWKQFILY